MKKVLFILFVVTLCFSCGDFLDSPKTTDSEIINFNVATKVENGILYFQSIQDVRVAMDYVSSKIKDARGSEIFSLLEKEFGHNSLKLSNSNLEVLTRDTSFEFSEAEILAIENADFINDDERKVLLNEHYELGIGNDVYVFYGENMDFKVVGGHQATLDGFRTLNKPGTTIPLDYISQYVEINKSNISIKHDIEINSDGWPNNEPNVEPREEKYILTTIFNNIPCEVFKKDIAGQLERQFVNDNNTPSNTSDDFVDYELYDGDWTVDYDDGDVDTYTGIPDFSEIKTYSSTGTFTVEITVDYVDTDGLNQSQTQFLQIEVNSTCTEDEQSLKNWQEENGKALLTKIWYKTDILGSCAGSKSHGFYWKASKGKWKWDYDTEIDVYIHASFLDSNCFSKNTKDESDSCNSCVKRKAQVRDWWDKRDISNGNIYSTNNAIFDNGVELSDNLVLDPC